MTGKTARLLDFFATNEILNLNYLLMLIATSLQRRRGVVPRSVLEAIKMGIWDFEPREVEYTNFDAADAMPGTSEKLTVLAERARRGLPLWHACDRDDMEAPPPPVLRRRRR